MDSNFIFRTGKHAGQTVEWVRDNDPYYLVWVEENRPEMLKEKKKPEPVKQKEVQAVEINYNSMQPNMNFWNEGPDPMCLPYIEKMRKMNEDEEYNF